MSVHRTPGETFAGYTDLEACVCPSCGVMMAAPHALLESAREQRQAAPVWCPNGHAWWYTGVSEHEALELERDRTAALNAELAQAKAEGRALFRNAERLRGERDRLRERIRAGVCPCCHRTVRQMRRHIESKHPGWAP